MEIRNIEYGNILIVLNALHHYKEQVRLCIFSSVLRT
jgi:hypothetical protein